MIDYVVEIEEELCQKTDEEFWHKIQAGPLEALSNIEMKDFKVENTIGAKQETEIYAMGSKESITGLKSNLSFADFLGYNIGSTKGKSSSNAFLKIYEDEMKATGISSIEEYLKQNKESIKAGEFEHKKYQPGKQLLSDMADIASFGVLPLIKAISGYDIITQEKLSETERAFAAVDAFLGFLAIGKLVSAGGKTASKIAGAYATDAASMLAGRAAGEIGEELGLPGWANIGLALFVGVKVSNGVSKMCLNMGGLDIELANDQLARIIKNTDNPKELGKLVENLDEAGLKEVVKELDKADAKRLQELLDDGTWKKVEAAIGGNGGKGVSGVEPFSIASSWQGNDIYTGIDNWSDVTLKKGEVYYRGEPGGGDFFTKKSSIESVSADKSKVFQGLQVQEHPVYGYRGEMQGYILKTDLSAAEAKCLANSQLGKGGLEQLFISNTQELIEKGILIPVENIKLK